MNLKHTLALLALLPLAGCVAIVDVEGEFEPHRAESFDEINVLIDDWHIAASEGDLEAYFGAMDDDSVFLGTDDWERWPRDQFLEFSTPHFEDGSGWTFEPHDRVIAFSDNGRVAWFDEKLDSEHMGKCRGSGVLEYGIDGWKIKHYNLTFTIPNDLVDDIVEQIEDYNADKEHKN